MAAEAPASALMYRKTTVSAVLLYQNNEAGILCGYSHITGLNTEFTFQSDQVFSGGYYADVNVGAVLPHSAN